MKIKVLGSSSKGNCYLLQLKTETLILECGINYKQILKGLNYDLESVVGCLVTHEHKDHSKAITELTENGIDIYTSKGTLEKL
ncbi:MBL fold metallo-hydrolase [Metaclostridioides mangenotii]|uniref:MBL fold metallo-hydrolase n=1 Tax=Metaclostridioides mangenotii TaxID=1540 RepID=UPI0004654C76|nr:MBL fold metallo-hydrolase [Clostridioides mangenotii]